MKRNYIKPSIRVKEIDMESSVLTSSQVDGESKEIITIRSNNITESNQVGAKPYSPWATDEDE